MEVTFVLLQFLSLNSSVTWSELFNFSEVNFIYKMEIIPSLWGVEENQMRLGPRN